MEEDEELEGEEVDDQEEDDDYEEGDGEAALNANSAEEEGEMQQDREGRGLYQN